MKALLFDCDGVLVNTEMDGHRVAFNRAFSAYGLAVKWDKDIYKELLLVAGGKERMTHYFDQTGWPDELEDRDTFIKELHALKTDLFMEIIEVGELDLRPGIARIVDEAIAAEITLGVCSTSNVRAVTLIVEKLLGRERAPKFGIFAGDMVSAKKPDPAVYLLASRKLNVEPTACMVIEDSENGLVAAKRAGMKCLVTLNGYSEEDYSAAEKIVSELGDEPNIQVDLPLLKSLF